MDNAPTRQLVAIHWLRTLLLAFLVCLGYLVASQFDVVAYRAFEQSQTSGEDWHRLLRIMGYVPTWIVVALILGMLDWDDVKKVGFYKAMWRPGLLMLSVLLSGIAAEVLKVLIRRERPNMHDAEYAWRSWLDSPLYTGGLSTPSSHAAVAFAAAFMLCYLVPRGRILWIALAIGCGLTRVISGAHWVGDIYISAVISYFVAHLLWQQHARNNPQASLDTTSFLSPR